MGSGIPNINSSLYGLGPGKGKKPAVKDQDLLKQMLGDSWKHYKEFMIEDDGRPICDIDASDIDGDGNTSERNTFSEGVSYVLLRAALMGDKKTFDKVWLWVQANMQRKNISQIYDPETGTWKAFDSSKQDHLFVWRFHDDVDGNGRGGVLDNYDFDPASDAEQDIAAALIIAHQKWGSKGAVNYRQEAQAILNDIWNKETVVISGKRVLIAGDTQKYTKNPINGESTWGVNPSYLRPTYYESLFANFDTSHDWKSMVAPSYEIIQMAADATLHNESKQKVKGKVNLVPDFIALNSSFKVVDHGWSKGDHSRNDYYWGGDAFRTLYWMALQKKVNPADQKAIEYLQQQSNVDRKDFGPHAFLKQQLEKHGTIYNGYNIDGSVHWRDTSLQTLSVYMLFFLAAGDTESAQKVYDVIQANYAYQTEGYWGYDQNDYYGQNWMWFALYLMLDDTKFGESVATFTPSKKEEKQPAIVAKEPAKASPKPAPLKETKYYFPPEKEILIEALKDLSPLLVPDPTLGEYDNLNNQIPVLNVKKAEKQLKTYQIAKILLALLLGIEVDIENILEDPVALAELMEKVKQADLKKIMNPNLLQGRVDTLFKHYPELAIILKIDQAYGQSVFSYLYTSNFNNNLIKLLSVFALKTMETGNTGLCKLAYEIAKKFKARIKAQEAENRKKVWQNQFLASDYNKALLNLTLAEFAFQTENTDEGIKYTKAAMKGFISIQDEPAFKADPDYLSVMKALILLGDLYAQAGKIKKAEKCYKAINKNGIDYAPLKLFVSRKELDKAINANLQRGYITLKQKTTAQEATDEFIIPLAQIRIGELYLEQSNDAKTKKDRIKYAELAKEAFASISQENLDPFIYAQLLIRQQETESIILSAQKNIDLRGPSSDIIAELEIAKSKLVELGKTNSFFYYFALFLQAKQNSDLANYYRKYPEQRDPKDKKDYDRYAYDTLGQIPKNFDYLYYAAVIEQHAIVAQAQMDLILTNKDTLDRAIAFAKKGTYLKAAGHMAKAELLMMKADKCSDPVEAKKLLKRAKDLCLLVQKNKLASAYLLAKSGILYHSVMARYPKEVKDPKYNFERLTYWQGKLEDLGDKDSYLWGLAEFTKGQFQLAIADKSKKKSDYDKAKQLFSLKDIDPRYKSLHEPAELLTITIITRDPDAYTITEVEQKLKALEKLNFEDNPYYAVLQQVTQAELYLAIADKIEKGEKATICQSAEGCLAIAMLLINPALIPEKYAYLHNKAVILYAALVARQKDVRASLIASQQFKNVQNQLNQAITHLEKDEETGYLLTLAYATKAEMLLQSADIPGTSLDDSEKYLAEADTTIRKALELAEPGKFLHAKATLLQGAIYVRAPKLANATTIQQNIKRIDELISKNRFEKESYFHAFSIFTMGQLYLTLANKEVKTKENLHLAKILLMSPVLQKDPFLYSSSLLRLVEIAVRTSDYINKEDVDGQIYLSPNENIKSIETLCSTCKTSLEELEKQASEPLLIQIELYELSLTLSDPINRETYDLNKIDTLIARCQALPEPSKSIFVFDLEAKKAALHLERVALYKKAKQKEKAQQEYEKAQKIIVELENKFAKIKGLSQRCEWNIAYLKAEFFALAANYYAMEQKKAEKIEKYSQKYYENKHKAVTYAKQAYLICEASETPYLHEWLPKLIDQNSGISREDALKVRLAYDPSIKATDYPTPTEIVGTTECIADPIGCLFKKPAKAKAKRVLPFAKPEELGLTLTKTWQYYKNKWISASGQPLSEKKITYSEGASYVLLRAVLMDDQETFDKVWAWTQNKLQRKNITKVYDRKLKRRVDLDPHKKDHLFAWKYLPGKGVTNDSNFDPASDADQDIAAALLLAHQRWGKKEYKKEALAILKDIWEKETVVVDGKRVLIAGDTYAGTQDPFSGENTVGINPSYLRPTYYETLFAQADPAHNWQELVIPSYQILNLAGSADMHDEKGRVVKRKVSIFPDWIALNKDFKIKDFGWEKDDHKKISDYYAGGDAFRTFFWLALQADNHPKDYLANGYFKQWGPHAFFKKQLAQHGTIFSGYNIDGSIHWPSKTPQTLAAYMCFFVANGDMKSAEKIYKKLMSLNKNNTSWGSYYADNWAWFGLAYLNGMFDFAK